MVVSLQDPSRTARTLGLATLLAFIPELEAHAYCTLPQSRYSFYDPQQCHAADEIMVYINSDERTLERTGLALDDIERLVRAALAAYNESGAWIPRLSYGGRVTHDTRFAASLDPIENATLAQAYRDAWAESEPDRPLGITIEAGECPSTYSGAAAHTAAPPGNVGFDVITFRPFWDDAQVVCPRVPETINCAGQPNPDVPVGDECPNDEGTEVVCDCSEGPPMGRHACQLNDDGLVVWTDCLCTGRGYEAYNLGDGQPHPVEVSTPALQTCDAAGEVETNDFLGILMHELGHALGMNHANVSVDQCITGLSAIGNTQGIMRTGHPSSDGWHRVLSRGRRPHADDLEGMIAFFDSLEVPWKRDFRLKVYESTDGGLTWDTGPCPTSRVWARARGLR